MHYTDKFLEEWHALQPIFEADTSEDKLPSRTAFRDAMLRLGHEERVRNLYRVKDKLSRKSLFFVPNGPQENYLSTKTNRTIILKIRQVGFTTLSCIRALDYALWEPNAATGIMAHLQTVVSTIFQDLVKFPYNWFKKDWGHLYSPVENSDSSTSLSFKTDGLGRLLNSNMRVLYDFRSKTPTFLHVSEASRIDPERLLGSFQGVPVNGEIVMESTPNGMGGEFHRQWENWRAMGSLAPYKGYFIPWYDFYPEQPEDPKWEWPRDLKMTDYEKSLLQEYPGIITKTHLAWRRWCIEANCQGDPDLFENEYPTNDVDCFVTGASMVFSSSIIKLQRKYVRPPTYTGFVLAGADGVEFREDRKGLVSVWAKPEPGTSYSIGADASGGVGKDNAAAVIFNDQTGEQAATLHGQVEPTDFAHEVWKLALWYNKAWINPEANNHGHVVIQALKNKLYRNLYKRKQLDHVTNKVTTVQGFLTTNDSKLMLTEKFKSAAKDGKVQLRDGRLLSEMTTFFQVASKNRSTIRREAASGCHDDLVMAASLAWEMHDQRAGTHHGYEDDTSTGADEDSGTYFDEETGFAV